jgi:hypothetical protein
VAKRTASSTDVYLFAHSDEEFKDVPALRRFIKTDLMKDNQGEYHVVTARLYRRLQTGDLVVFHKKRKFVGEGLVADSVVEYPKRVKIGDGWYTGHVLFREKGLTPYQEPIDFQDVERKLRKAVSSRSPCQSGNQVYEVLRKLI